MGKAAIHFIFMLNTVVIIAMGKAQTGGQNAITYGWSVNLILRNGS